MEKNKRILNCFYCLENLKAVDVKWIKFDSRMLIRKQDGSLYGTIPSWSESIVSTCTKCIERRKI